MENPSVESGGEAQEEDFPMNLDVVLVGDEKGSRYAQVLSASEAQCTVRFLSDGSRETLDFEDYKIEAPILHTVGDLIDGGHLKNKEADMVRWSYESTDNPELRREVKFWGGLRKRSPR